VLNTLKIIGQGIDTLNNDAPSPKDTMQFPKIMASHVTGAGKQTQTNPAGQGVPGNEVVKL
jgi:hypothetical protein